MKISFVKRVFTRIATVCMISACTFLSVQAFDMPSFYRAPLFQTEATSKVKNWTTVLSARLAYGQTSDSFDKDEETTKLFNDRGAFDLLRLGLNIEDIASKPTTNIYWGTGGLFENPYDTTIFEPNDGKFKCGGEFTITELDLDLKQNLMWGFYAHLYVPFKDLKIDKIEEKNLGRGVVNTVNMDDFVKTDLPKILEENGLKKITPSFKDSGCGDVALSVGWQGYSHKLLGFLSSAGGLVQCGVVIPAASRQDVTKVFSLPLGYNEHVGIVSRLAAEVTVSNMFALGIQAGSTIFFKDNRDIFLKTEKQQNGWIFLQKARVKEDLGSFWDAGGYIKANLFVKGLDFLIGYSFSKQERTSYEVNDSNYLKTAQAEILAQLQGADPVHIGTDAPNIMLISQNDYANSDARLGGWEIQTIHLVAQYDMSEAIKGGWGPLFKLEFNCPIWGKYSWATWTVAGTLGFTVTFNF